EAWGVVVLKKVITILSAVIGLVFLQDFLRITSQETRAMPLRAERFSENDRPQTIPKLSQKGLSYFVPDFATNGEESGCWLEPGICANTERPYLSVHKLQSYMIFRHAQD